MRLFKKMSLAVLVMFSLLVPQMILAQEYPAKPVTVIIPFGPGGGHDLLFRAVTSVAVDHLGQPIIIRLMPGGGGAIAADFAAKAAPDGYTLFAGGNIPSISLPAIEGRSKGPEYWEPVCRLNYNQTIIVSRPDAPFKTWKQMMEWAKANPGKLVVGTPGPWSPPDVIWKTLMKEMGITVKLVPFDGGGPVTVALLGGHIDVGSALPIIYSPYKNTGKMNALLTLEDRRLPDLPNTPTSIEEGVPGAATLNMLGYSWRGVMAPKGTSRAIVDKLATAFKKMTEDPSVKAMIKQYGDEIQYLGADDFAKVLTSEFNVYKELGKVYKK